MDKRYHFAPYEGNKSPCGLRVSRRLGEEHEFEGYAAITWDKVTCDDCLRWNPDATHLLGPENAHGDRPACHAGMSKRKFVDKNPTYPKCARIERGHEAAKKLSSSRREHS